MHDFRVVVGNTHTNIIFDVVIPFDSEGYEYEIKKMVNEKLMHYEKKYYAVIEFDREYN